MGGEEGGESKKLLTCWEPCPSAPMSVVRAAHPHASRMITYGEGVQGCNNAHVSGRVVFACHGTTQQESTEGRVEEEERKFSSFIIVIGSHTRIRTTAAVGQTFMHSKYRYSATGCTCLSAQS